MADFAPEKRRFVFISASFLSKQYKTIPDYVMMPSIFFFGGKRSWLFPTNREEMKEAREQKYLEFDEDFKSIILKKEGEGLCFWFKPDNDFKKASEFFEAIQDPVSGDDYLPLVTDEDWWRSELDRSSLKFVGGGSGSVSDTEVEQIVSQIKNGEFEYETVQELIYQSNPTLQPTLYWASEAKEN